jgi:hypothetical protein
MSQTEHSLFSSYREALLEHLFAGEVMRYLWTHGVHRMEVLKPQVDDGGYDLVLEADKITRHVQLKASHAGSSTRRVNVGRRLQDKPGGCVVWMIFNPDTLELGPFCWLGDAPERPLPDLDGFPVAKHTKGNALGVKLPRPGIRSVPRSEFTRLDTVAEVVDRLFGPIESLRAHGGGNAVSGPQSG